MITKEIEAMFAAQDHDDEEEGVFDSDAVFDAFERLKSIATKANLPTLADALRSPKNDACTRELFAELICPLGGFEYLEQLLEAAQLNWDEGHDNDGFYTSLIDLAFIESENCRAKLVELLSRDNFKHGELARCLLDYCKADKSGGVI